ncbi:MAG TPA: hypothetical protein VLH13_01215, partial [Methanomassiliicoccales archaeon]|nr:hypothetical protein [Methanomassiliicoccales archaeon]
MRKTSEKTATGGKGPTAPAGRSDGESAVLAKIAEMPEPYRTMGARLHSMIDSISPVLSPKVWYGMPAYA